MGALRTAASRGTRTTLRLTTLAASLAGIFAPADIGDIFDPSDMSTMWQDAAGTTPAAIEQPVGRIVGKVRGTVATQATAGARPILCARLNQHVKSEDLTDAAWTKTACTIVPNGFGTLDKIVEDGTAGAHRVSGFSLTGSAGMAFVQSFRLAPGERTRGVLTFSNTTPWSGGVAPSVDFSLTGAGVIHSATGGTAAIVALGDGSYRLTFAVVCAGAGNFVARLGLHNGASSSYTGDSASGFYAGEDQLELGTAFTRYQWIDTATVYDTNGFRRYLRFDAATHWLGFTLGSAFTAGTIVYMTMTELVAGAALYGPNTVNVAGNVGFGVGDSFTGTTGAVVSGNGVALNVLGQPTPPVMPHVITGTADGATQTVRVGLAAATSTAVATNFNGTSWRIGRSLDDAGPNTGRMYFAFLINRVLSTAEQDRVIRAATG